MSHTLISRSGADQGSPQPQEVDRRSHFDCDRSSATPLPSWPWRCITRRRLSRDRLFVGRRRPVVPAGWRGDRRRGRHIESVSRRIPAQQFPQPDAACATHRAAVERHLRLPSRRRLRWQGDRLLFARLDCPLLRRPDCWRCWRLRYVAVQLVHRSAVAQLICHQARIPHRQRRRDRTISSPTYEPRMGGVDIVGCRFLSETALSGSPVGNGKRRCSASSAACCRASGRWSRMRSSSSRRGRIRRPSTAASSRY